MRSGGDDVLDEEDSRIRRGRSRGTPSRAPRSRACREIMKSTRSLAPGGPSPPRRGEAIGIDCGLGAAARPPAPIEVDLRRMRAGGLGESSRRTPRPSCGRSTRGRPSFRLRATGQLPCGSLVANESRSRGVGGEGGAGRVRTGTPPGSRRLATPQVPPGWRPSAPGSPSTLQRPEVDVLGGPTNQLVSVGHQAKIEPAQPLDQPDAVLPQPGNPGLPPDTG